MKADVLKSYYFLSPVRGDVCWVCKVSPQPGGGWDVLWTDCPMGQQEQQAYPCPKNPPVCSCTHSNAHTQTNLLKLFQSEQYNCVILSMVCLALYFWLMFLFDS